MKKFKFNIRGNDYDVIVKYFEDGVAKVEVNGSPYHVEVEQQVLKCGIYMLLKQGIVQ